MIFFFLLLFLSFTSSTRPFFQVNWIMQIFFLFTIKLLLLFPRNRKIEFVPTVDFLLLCAGEYAWMCRDITFFLMENHIRMSKVSALVRSLSLRIINHSGNVLVQDKSRMLGRIWLLRGWFRTDSVEQELKSGLCEAIRIKACQTKCNLKGSRGIRLCHTRGSR